MKKIVLLFMVIFTIAFSGCTRSASNAPGDVYYGVVLFTTCNCAVIQTDGSPNTIGQDTWTSGTNVYHHVFRVQNWCQFGNHPQGSNIRFKVIPGQTQNCMACMIAVDAPDSTIPILIF